MLLSKEQNYEYTTIEIIITLDLNYFTFYLQLRKNIMHYVTYQHFSKWVYTIHITCKSFDVCLAEMKNLFLIIFIWLESKAF